MYQVWMDDRLYGVWPELYMAENIKSMLEVTYPTRKIEIRTHI